MEIYWRSAICSSLIWFCLSTMVLAAPLPGADQPETQLRLGTGPSLGASLKINPIWEIGLSAAYPALNFQQGSYFQFDTARLGAYSLVQLLNINGFYIAGVAGVFTDFAVVNEFSPPNTWGIQAGAAFAYDLNSALTVRVNIVPGIDFNVPPNGWLLSPASGVALVWRPQPNIALSFGVNGNGDLLGLSWGF